MAAEATITNSSTLELKNVPTKLILYAISQWQPCGLYAKLTGVGNNTNPFLKAISVWIILKNQTTSGAIKNYRSQLNELAAKCKMTERTLYKYLSWLQKEGLINRENGTLLLSQYNVLRKYSINISEKEKPIIYDTNGKINLPEILISLGLQKLKDRWANMYWKKIHKNPDEFKLLNDLFIKFGASAQKLEVDADYFRQCHLELLCQSFEEEKPGQPVFYFLHNTIKANPDLNASTGTYGRILGYALQEKFNETKKRIEYSSMGFSHLKKRLEKKSLISVKKDHIEGFERARKDVKHFNVRWLSDLKHTLWFRCDQVSVNVEKIFKNSEAA